MSEVSRHAATNRNNGSHCWMQEAVKDYVQGDRECSLKASPWQKSL